MVTIKVVVKGKTPASQSRLSATTVDLRLPKNVDGDAKGGLDMASVRVRIANGTLPAAVASAVCHACGLDGSRTHSWRNVMALMFRGRRIELPDEASFIAAAADVCEGEKLFALLDIDAININGADRAASTTLVARPSSQSQTSGAYPAFAAASASPAASSRQSDPSAQLRGMSGFVPPPPSALGRGATGGRMPPQMAEMMAQMMTSNPAMIDMMIRSQPELAALARDNPEMLQELRNPNTMRDMIRAALDPEARRDMERSADLQLAQVASHPDGAALLQRTMGSVERSLEDAANHGNGGGSGTRRRGREQVEDEETAAAVSELHVRTVEGAASNAASLPNPWARPSAPPVPSSSAWHNAPAQAQPRADSLATVSVPATVSSDVPPPRGAPNDFPFAAQLLVLTQDMGFTDTEVCKLALMEARGNVDAAVDLMASWQE